MPADEFIAVRACRSNALRQRFIGWIAFQRIDPGDRFGAAGQLCHFAVEQRGVAGIPAVTHDDHNRCHTVVHGHWYLVDSWA